MAWKLDLDASAGVAAAHLRPDGSHVRVWLLWQKLGFGQVKLKRCGSRHAYKQSLWIAVDYNIIINGALEQPAEVVTGVFLRICMRSY